MKLRMETGPMGVEAVNAVSYTHLDVYKRQPTDNRVALASKGALRAVFKCTGKMAHSAYPELGESAVHKLVTVLARLLAAPLPELEGIGPSTLNIGQIHGGHAPNVIADQAEAQVLVRTVTDSALVRAQLTEIAGDLATVEFTLDMPFVRLRAVEGLPTMVAKFSTDKMCIRDSFNADAAVEGCGDVAGAQRAGKNFRSRRVQSVES